MNPKDIMQECGYLLKMVKIRGDADEYHVYGIDYFNYQILVERNCGLEWVDFGKIQRIWGAE